MRSNTANYAIQPPRVRPYIPQQKIEVTDSKSVPVRTLEITLSPEGFISEHALNESPASVSARDASEYSMSQYEKHTVGGSALPTGGHSKLAKFVVTMAVATGLSGVPSQAISVAPAVITRSTTTNAGQSSANSKLEIVGADDLQIEWRSLMRKQLDKIQGLEENWDGYGSLAPNHTSIENARSALLISEQLELPPSGVAPAADGGTIIVFFSNHRRAEVEFLNSGEVVIGMDDGVAYPQVWELTMDSQEIAKSLRRIREFLSG